MSEIIRVKIADLAVMKDDGLLITVGLGSCVGIALYDTVYRVAGLAHILLADSAMFRNQDNLAKFADTAIPLLADEMARQGARNGRLAAKIAGGSQLFSFENSALSVGEKNIQMARQTLSKLKIPLLAEDVGGSTGRTMRVYVREGRVTVTTAGGEEREI
ncbi:MAG: chemotaxis protein CheD [Dethiobacter sp.]|nr:chemotaxis protein CheD [Dethiobacter sp.]MCL5981452.1 chemotaxis protein CheD [Bacillota bacterium]